MKPTDRVQVFREKRGPVPRWRWRVKAANRRTIATSGESFVSRGNAVRAAIRVTGREPE
jgi:uncharacterized protein YegP (UPF0339 family)